MRKKTFTHLQALIFIVLAATATFRCSSEDEVSPNQIKMPTDKGFEYLSEYNFFVGEIAELTPNEEARVLPYDLNTPLFSDYALKKRFIYVPEGKSIPFQTNNVLDLPVGSVLIKHFYYGEKDYIETRLLIRNNDGWQPETYIWEEDLSDARRSVIGGTRKMTLNIDGEDQIFNYMIPNQNQCKNCHAYDGKIAPIGPEIPNLNKTYNYAEGEENQIQKWISAGILEGHSDTNIPAWPAIDDQSATLDDRARAYLAINCASCHRAEGSAANSGLYLGFHVDEPINLGYWKTPTAAGDGSGGLRYVIHPGNAEESILMYRLNSSEVEVRMPELGRELIHKEGVELIRDWINSLESE
ncbi:SO2930 family diheme c-type cytochrome [Sediminitomix flava]|uniref:Putative repeat protein (TIGR03806 family) n=1 Tax=Sediminitomix flava TaxID=379075 RepID=A0A315Z758_SEDFL|nr:SO2930 family diheme c-type cytochrome [Sediminitomix flava]PWJ40052.1 putative repeat protein (TIGR03806 family) [Sediminitomix flava]